MASTVQLSQEVIEVVQSDVPASVRVSQEVIEVVQSRTAASVVISQFVIEVIRVRQSIIAPSGYAYPPTVQ